MGERDIERIFERLDSISQRLASIEAGQSAAKEAALDTSVKLDAIRTNGCVMGREHERRLSTLEVRPERTLSIVGGVLGACGAVAGIIAWMRGP